MPVEIRELIIKTEVKTFIGDTKNTIDANAISKLKYDVLEECKRLLTEKRKRVNYRR